MNAKERFDACMKIAEFGNKNFHGRRQFEWKVNLTFWALLVGATGFLKYKHLPELNQNALIWLLPALVIAFAFLWLRGTWVANENDKSMSLEFLLAADAILRDPNHIPKPIPPKMGGWRLWLGFFTDWARWFQLITTAVLAAILYLVAGQTQTAPLPAVGAC